MLKGSHNLQLIIDDSLILCRATQNESGVINELLTLYEEAFGKCFNMEKSYVFFCKNTSLHRELVKAALGVREVDCFESYLGLPILIGCPKYQTFSFLKDRVWNKMHG